MTEREGFTISDADTAAANAMAEDVSKCIATFVAGVSDDLLERPDKVGSIVANLLLAQAWQAAAVGRLVTGGDPRKHFFVEAAENAAERNPLGEMVMRFILNWAERDRPEWRLATEADT